MSQTSVQDMEHVHRTTLALVKMGTSENIVTYPHVEVSFLMTQAIHVLDKECVICLDFVIATKVIRASCAMCQFVLAFWAMSLQSHALAMEHAHITTIVIVQMDILALHVMSLHVEVYYQMIARIHVLDTDYAPKRTIASATLDILVRCVKIHFVLEKDHPVTQVAMDMDHVWAEIYVSATQTSLGNSATLLLVEEFSQMTHPMRALDKGLALAQISVNV
mmetsp:Transcript_11077/g.41340  ORF Transcript_11077/g.41340 Transcript_11077/m.41340 type:complete len:220 (+) Transcript_11077:4391-5050(+)